MSLIFQESIYIIERIVYLRGKKKKNLSLRSDGLED